MATRKKTPEKGGSRRGRRARGGKNSKQERGPGRPPRIPDEQLPVLRGIVLERPVATIDEVSQAFEKVTGIKVCRPVIVKAIERAGIKRSKPEVRSSTSSEDGDAKPKVYGYTEVHRDPGDEDRYPSCLTDAEWELVHGFFENKDGRGQPPKYERRLMVDACCYVVRTGCSWRMLPKDFPPWTVVYKTFRRWTDKGIFEVMHDCLRGMWRERVDRNVGPTAAVLDSQSIRTSEQGGPKGYDAGKKIRGRKRHLLVDTLGLLLAVCLLPANIQDRDGAVPVVAQGMEKYPSVQKLYVDGAYAGKCKTRLEGEHGIDVEVVRKPQAVGYYHDAQQKLFEIPKGFVVLPMRWVVERTHAWNERSRRLAKDHDRRLDVGESWIWLVEARLLARRLAALVEV